MDAQEKPQVLFTSAEIAAAVDRLAREITREYVDKCPVLIGVLKGSFIFMADLVRRLGFPVEVEFLTLSSYGGTRTTGKIKVRQPLRCPIKGRDVLVVEDIIDTGLSLGFLMDYLKKKGPASVRLCALLDKPSRRIQPVNIDYPGFTVPDKFIVGYGLDYDQRFRNLPDICTVEGE